MATGDEKLRHATNDANYVIADGVPIAVGGVLDIWANALSEQFI